MSIRTERVASVIREALAQPLADLGSELMAGMVTVTHVRVSADLRHARVYLSIFNGKMDAETAIRKISDRMPQLRRQLGAAVHLRYTPDLKFFLDDTLDTMNRIQQLIDETRQRDAEQRGTAPDQSAESGDDISDATST